MLWPYVVPVWPFGRVAGETVIVPTPHATVILYVRPPVQPFVSVAVIVKVNVPTCVGVPVTSTDVVVAFERPRPGGNAPDVTLNVALAEPLSVIICV